MMWLTERLPDRQTGSGSQPPAAMLVHYGAETAVMTALLCPDGTHTAPYLLVMKASSVCLSLSLLLSVCFSLSLSLSLSLSDCPSGRSCSGAHGKVLLVKEVSCVY